MMIIGKWLILSCLTVPFLNHGILWSWMLFCDILHIYFNSFKNIPLWQSVFLVFFELMSIIYVSAITYSDIFIYLYGVNLMVYMLNRNIVALGISLFLAFPIMYNFVLGIPTLIALAIVAYLIAAIIGIYIGKKEQNDFEFEKPKILLQNLYSDDTKRKEVAKMVTIMQSIKPANGNEMDLLKNIVNTYKRAVNPAVFAYYIWEHKEKVFKNIKSIQVNKNSLISPSDCIMPNEETLIGSRYYEPTSKTIFVSEKDQKGIVLDAICIFPFVVNNTFLGVMAVGLNNTNELTKDIDLCYLISQQAMMAFENLILTNHFKEKAIMDNLTNLYNRQYFEVTFKNELSRALSLNKPLAYMAIDVDFFKQLNDTHGHPYGDAVLKKVAEIIKNSIRGNDFAFRLGGDEFSILMPTASYEIAIKRAKEISAAYYGEEFGGKLKDSSTGKTLKEVRSSFSIGIAVFPLDAATPSDLIAAADKALYRAKKHKNCIAVINDPEKIYSCCEE